MTTTQQLKFNTTGQIVWIALPHRPSSVTSVSVFESGNPSDGTSETALGSPTVSTGSTTVDAASGRSQSNPKKLFVTATTNMVIGQRWIVTAAATGDDETFLIDKIAPNDYVIAQRPFAGDYANADTVTFPRLQATIDSTWIADESNLSEPLNPNPRWRVEWTYVYNSETYVAVSYLDVSYQPFHHGVTMDSCDRLFRGLAFRLSTDDQADNGDEVIEEAAHQVKLDLKERRTRAYALRNSDELNECIRLKTAELVALHQLTHGGVSPDQYALIKEMYWERVNNLISSGIAEQQVTAEGASGLIRRAPISRR